MKNAKHKQMNDNKSIIFIFQFEHKSNIITHNNNIINAKLLIIIVIE